MAGWVVIIPPIRPSKDGIYVGQDGRPAEVALADPLFGWTIYGHYQSGAQCEAVRHQLDDRSLNLDPSNATAVAWSFAKCLQDNDSRLRPNGGPLEILPNPPTANARS
jgi:hypothetical protein